MVKTLSGRQEQDLDRQAGQGICRCLRFLDKRQEQSISTLERQGRLRHQADMELDFHRTRQALSAAALSLTSR